MPLSTELKPAADGSPRPYRQQLRLSIAARASVLDLERRRFHEELDVLRSRASNHRR